MSAREAKLELTVGQLGYITADGSKRPQRLLVTITLEYAASTGSALFSGGMILVDELISGHTESPYIWEKRFNVPSEDPTPGAHIEGKKL